MAPNYGSFAARAVADGVAARDGPIDRWRARRQVHGAGVHQRPGERGQHQLNGDHFATVDQLMVCYEQCVSIRDRSIESIGID